MHTHTHTQYKNVVLFCLCAHRQVLALVFVRKLLDFFFSKRELSYLDDIMPESKRKKEDDKKKKAQEKLVSLKAQAATCSYVWGGSV